MRVRRGKQRIRSRRAGWDEIKESRLVREKRSVGGNKKTGDKRRLVG